MLCGCNASLAVQCPQIAAKSLRGTGRIVQDAGVERLITVPFRSSWFQFKIIRCKFQRRN
jgi:hypothetical protein